MKTAILIHGMPSRKGYYNPQKNAPSNSHWFPWIQKQLLLKNILTQAPEMPLPYKPNYQAWKKIFEQFTLNKDTILIGHSCGAGFIVRYLSENKVKVGRVVLVAPWLDPEKSLKNGMFDFEIDKNLSRKTNGITIFNSTNDAKYIQDSVKKIKNKVKKLKVIEFKNMGHFCYRDMKTDAFPELLKEALKKNES